MTAGNTDRDDLGRLARMEARLTKIESTLGAIEGGLDRMLKIWDDHAHIVVAFRRGGVMAARTAARRGGNSQ